MEFTCSNAPAKVYKIHIPNHSLHSKVRLSCETDADVAAAASQDYDDEINSDKELDAAKKSARVVVIKYGAPWCGPCRSYDAAVEGIKKATAGLEVKYYHVNVDHFRGEIQGNGIPEIQFFKDGKYVTKVVGFPGASVIVDKVKSLLK